jgi:[ribosomal protein S5]-alanine N-acetyltransferase
VDLARRHDLHRPRDPRVLTEIDKLFTLRMTAERLRPEHEDALLSLLGDPRVGATLGGVQDRAEVRDGLARHVAHWDREGFGYWLFRDRRTGEVAGRGGLERKPVAGREEVEVGWTVAPERWGQGLATEMGHLAVHVAFDHLGLEEVVAYTLKVNAASERVMHKLGFRYERDIEYAGLPHVLYRLRAPGE